MKRQTSEAVLALLIAVCIHPAHADEGVTFKFSGYGTVGAVVTNTDEAQFKSSVLQSNGAGKSPSFSVDSRLGLQEDVKFNTTFSAVGQLLISNRDGREQPRVEWLFGQAHVTPWLDLRVGRMVMPVFLVSDSRNVGYASHWVRAPGEVYINYPASAFDGVQALMQTDWGGTNFALQASMGTTNIVAHAFGATFALDFKKMYSLNLVAEHGPWTFRLGDTEGRDLALTGFGPLPPLSDSFRGVGVSRDNGKLLLQAEYFQRRTNMGGAFDQNGYYVTGGYRFGAWTPYAIYGLREPRGSLEAGEPDTRTIAAGLRWDAVKNVAIKAQVESAQNNGSNFGNATSPTFVLGRRVNVFTLLADFVF